MFTVLLAAAAALWLAFCRRRAGDAVLDRGPGGQQDVVLVHAHHVGALAAEHADHAEGDVLDADFLADRRLAVEQLADQRLAEQADLVAVAHVAVGEGFALGQSVQSRTSRNAGVVP